MVVRAPGYADATAEVTIPEDGSGAQQVRMLHARLTAQRKNSSMPRSWCAALWGDTADIAEATKLLLLHTGLPQQT